MFGFKPLVATSLLITLLWIQLSWALDGDVYDTIGIDLDLLVKYRGFILAVNGQQTTCEVGALYINAGIVAASCFRLVENNTLDSSYEYSVLFYNGSHHPSPVVYPVDIDDIQIHPSFNNDTFINNVAIIQFNKNATDPSAQLLAITETPTYNTSYVLRTVDPETDLWNNISNHSYETPSMSICDEVGQLYSANRDYMFCSNLTTTSVYNGSCTVPYSSLYLSSELYIGLVGIYSHSVVLGSDECSDPKISFYTNLIPFHYFVEIALRQPVYIISTGNYTDEDITNIQKYEMKLGAAVNMTGKTLVSGDFFARQHPVQISDSDEPSDDTLDDPETGNSNSSGTSKTTKIIVGVVVGVGTLLLSIIVGFGVYWWKKRGKLNRIPHTEAIDAGDLANEIFVEEGSSQPPPYLHDTSLTAGIAAAAPAGMEDPEKDDSEKKKD